MVKDDMQSEIDTLRAQVAELKAEREAKAKEEAKAKAQPKAKAQARASGGQTPPKESPTPESETTEPTEEEGEEAKPEEADLSSLFQELVDTIEEEFKTANPLTVLVVFALGVLVGRLLPR
jgi:hypothetical protein